MVTELAADLDHLSLILRTHGVEGETVTYRRKSGRTHTKATVLISRKCKNFVFQLIQAYFVSIIGKRQYIMLGNLSSHI